MKSCLAAALVAISVLPAAGHDAPAGWRYDANCCSNRDCRPVRSSYVEERATGIHLTRSGEVLAYGDSRIKDSPDGLIHWCTAGRTDSGRTICLYMPPRSM